MSIIEETKQKYTLNASFLLKTKCLVSVRKLSDEDFLHLIREEANRRKIALVVVVKEDCQDCWEGMTELPYDWDKVKEQVENYLEGDFGDTCSNAVETVLNEVDPDGEHFR